MRGTARARFERADGDYLAMSLRLVDSPAGLVCTARTTVRHTCPFVDEIDIGQMVIEWVTGTKTIELHSLSSWLDTWTTERVSHEEMCSQVMLALRMLGGIGVRRVEYHAETAGIDITVLESR